MRATGARRDPDPVHQLDLETGTPAHGRLARAGPASAVPVTLVWILAALAVAIYGLETGRQSVAIVGMTLTALVAVVMAVKARTASRAEMRSREACDRALAKSERAQEELRLANERLQRKNADLEAFRLAVVQGFDLIDQRMQGRLKELVEEAGDDIAALVDDALDDPTEGA